MLINKVEKTTCLIIKTKPSL